MEARRLQNLIQQSIRRTQQVIKFAANFPDSDSKEKLLSTLASLRLFFDNSMLYPEKFGSAQLDDLQDELQELRRLSSIMLWNDGEQVREDFDHLWRGLWNLSLGMRIGLSSDAASGLSELIPDQKVAAFQFGFSQSRIVVLEEFANGPNETRAIIDAARDELLEQGLELIADIAHSNSGPRLLRRLQSVHARLDERKPVVQLGMATQSLAAAITGSKDELPTDLFSLLLAHVKNLYSYLAQFPDWQNFVQHSLMANLPPNDTEILISSAKAIADFLEANADYATADVSQALRTTATWTEGLENPDGRMIFALGRTIENLLSLISRTIVEIGEEARKEAVKAIAKNIVRFVQASCVGLVYTMAGLPGAEWLVSAFDALVVVAAR